MTQQTFYRADADRMFGRCRCHDDSGSCNWCLVYYFGVDADTDYSLVGDP